MSERKRFEESSYTFAPLNTAKSIQSKIQPRHASVVSHVPCFNSSPSTWTTTVLPPPLARLTRQSFGRPTFSFLFSIGEPLPNKKRRRENRILILEAPITIWSICILRDIALNTHFPVTYDHRLRRIGLSLYARVL